MNVHPNFNHEIQIDSFTFTKTSTFGFCPKIQTLFYVGYAIFLKQLMFLINSLVFVRSFCLDKTVHIININVYHKSYKII